MAIWHILSDMHISIQKLLKLLKWLKLVSVQNKWRVRDILFLLSTAQPQLLNQFPLFLQIVQTDMHCDRVVMSTSNSDIEIRLSAGASQPIFEKLTLKTKHDFFGKNRSQCFKSCKIPFFVSIHQFWPLLQGLCNFEQNGPVVFHQLCIHITMTTTCKYRQTLFKNHFVQVQRSQNRYFHKNFTVFTITVLFLL